MTRKEKEKNSEVRPADMEGTFLAVLEKWREVLCARGEPLGQFRVVGQLAARETLRPTGIDILSLVHS